MTLYGLIDNRLGAETPLEQVIELTETVSRPTRPYTAYSEMNRGGMAYSTSLNFHWLRTRSPKRRSTEVRRPRRTAENRTPIPLRGVKANQVAL